MSTNGTFSTIRGSERRRRFRFSTGRNVRTVGCEPGDVLLLQLCTACAGGCSVLPCIFLLVAAPALEPISAFCADFGIRLWHPLFIEKPAISPTLFKTQHYRAQLAASESFAACAKRIALLVEKLSTTALFVGLRMAAIRRDRLRMAGRNDPQATTRSRVVWREPRETWTAA